MTILIDEPTLQRWRQQARRDDWHAIFVGSDIRLMLGDIQRLRLAIRATASQGTYDELAIRKAVSFELAEMIVAERLAIKEDAE